MPIILAVEAGAQINVSGYRMAAQPFGSLSKLGDVTYQFFQLSVGTRPNEYQVDIEVDNQLAGSIEIVGFFPRPAWSAGAGSGGPTSVLSEELDSLLLSIVDLIRSADDERFAHHQIYWDRLGAAWESSDATTATPPMALIVRHARELKSLISDIAERPRNILNRTRNLTPVDRVQQMDVTCIRWLSRQPGTTVYERAGPRQRVMSVQRYESADTLENRVFRDVCVRSDTLARGYTKRYLSMAESQRWKEVDRYGRECRDIDRLLDRSAIPRPQPPVIPNYVLMHDVRYRRLWRAYLEIIRRLDEEDECWRWQHRLWSDFCRLIVQVALRREGSYFDIAESPLRILQEQTRGNWSSIDTQSAVWSTTIDNVGDVIVSYIWDTNSSHPKCLPWISSLGANAVLHCQRLDNGQEGYVVLWSIHHFSDEAPGLPDVVESASAAIEACRISVGLNEDSDLRVAGLVLMSDFDFVRRDDRDRRTRNGPVMGYRFSPSSAARLRILDRIPSTINGLVGEVFK